MTGLSELLQSDPFQGYAYSYPHKLAYRPLEPKRPLSDVWQHEDLDALFLYIHIPFCEMRCGFCNLFTTTGSKAQAMDAYVDALIRQMQVTSESLGPMCIARGAIGGGTPSVLSEIQLDRLFAGVERHLGSLKGAPLSFEVSPGTVTAPKIELLQRWSVSRVSMGVQSFVEAETRALGRPQDIDEVRRALRDLQGKFPVLNLDLIYGAEGQTAASWQRSLTEVVEYGPQEIYLYPLYVRPLTGLDKLARQRNAQAAFDGRLELYRQGRDFLLEHGYEAISMRLFRKRSVDSNGAVRPEGPVYCCQEDGMIGLGAGARSYTTALHYSTEYAVGRGAVQEIIHEFIERDSEALARVDYGCELSRAEQMRRFVIKSLLRKPGLDAVQFVRNFGFEADVALSQLNELVELRLAAWCDRTLELTSAGYERSDTIGPWLFSEEMKQRMEAYEWT